MTEQGGVTGPAGATGGRGVGRRDVLVGLGAFLGTSLMVEPAAALGSTREVTLVNAHTQDRLSARYMINGRYHPQVMLQVAHLMRDHRANRMRAIDPRLLDYLSLVQMHLGHQGEVHIVSGYRTPQTNAMLRTNSDGVAQNSYHIKGQAMDLRLPNVPVSRIRQAALAAKRGGVGYYPSAEFVHIDTGPVRDW